MSNVCSASSSCGRHAARLLADAGLQPLRVYLVEPDKVCFITYAYKARTAYVRAHGNGMIVEAAVDGWPV